MPGGARHALSVRVRLTDDPVKVLSAAGRFLAGRPVEHNLVLSLLAARAEAPEPGRYGWVAGGEGFAGIGGVIFNSPLGFPATVTPMVAAAAAALGEAVARAWPALAGVSGEAATASAVAGAFATVTGTPARPVEGQRLYRLSDLRPPAGVPGSARVAGPGDRQVVAAFVAGFYRDVGEGHRAAGADDHQAARMIDAGRLWLWEDPAAGDAEPAGPAVAMAQASAHHAGVARVGPVYTPPGLRGRGYGAAVTAAVSGAIVAAGATAILYTQLDNPTSNALYQRLGYEVVGEGLRYAFG
jgi:ribosomal protein S18 acetylase RimI-like enzyme